MSHELCARMDLYWDGRHCQLPGPLFGEVKDALRGPPIYEAEAAQLTAPLREREARLRLALRECMQHMSSLRDFVAEGGSVRMVGAREAIREADAAYERLGRLLADRTS